MSVCLHVACMKEIGETVCLDEFHTVERGWGSTEIIFILIMFAPHITKIKQFFSDSKDIKTLADIPNLVLNLPCKFTIMC